MSVAVITGAASGIGAGLARHAVSLGMNVVLADRDAALLAEVAGAIGERAIAVPTDVTDPDALETLAARAYDAFGQVDLFFNNAGILTTGLSWEITAEKWRQVLDVNVLGVINGIRAFVPRLIAADRAARIIITSSIGGFLPSPMLGPYAASKFALVAIAETLAGELAMLKSPVKVSLLAPGAVKTQIFRDDPTATSGAFVDQMLAMADKYGLTPDSFAALVFASIDRGDYWIIPQPDSFDPGFEARNANISARQQPNFYLVDEAGDD
jgi:NAD(P)-dependent dehydrogenase (short-subunit alcohol dehydrogenase family)